jgi:hypothetical protein
LISERKIFKFFFRLHRKLKSSIFEKTNIVEEKKENDHSNRSYLNLKECRNSFFCFCPQRKKKKKKKKKCNAQKMFKTIRKRKEQVGNKINNKMLIYTFQMMKWWIDNVRYFIYFIEKNLLKKSYQFHQWIDKDISILK